MKKYHKNYRSSARTKCTFVGAFEDGSFNHITELAAPRAWDLLAHLVVLNTIWYLFWECGAGHPRLLDDPQDRTPSARLVIGIRPKIPPAPKLMSLPCADHRDEGIFHTQGIGTSPSLAAEVEVVWVKNGSIGLVEKNYVSLLGAGVVKRPRYLESRHQKALRYQQFSGLILDELALGAASMDPRIAQSRTISRVLEYWIEACTGRTSRRIIHHGFDERASHSPEIELHQSGTRISLEKIGSLRSFEILSPRPHGKMLDILLPDAYPKLGLKIV
ncbi:hypothetical protein DEU56DRAFT_916781 [Suillus clintonianus]|uniref:uncharacterized protein n=1 Tax=Suillus clintonianus TaxID=1904413 RepID=UPI001B87A6E8|nr:uncharacterized protein DEU56DRAFT_916781 [Suillus clintonianus]KAG2125053.1 hypothetical protein DEU56DRAFT_916781 [Suillus clintonianus]